MIMQYMILKETHLWIGNKFGGNIVMRGVNYDKG